jgi:excisionase family DNA binding protein
METQLLTANQVADRLQIALSTVYTWLREGRIPGFRMGGRWRISEADLVRVTSRAQSGGRAAGKCLTRSEGSQPVGESLLEILADVTRDIPREVWDELPPDASLNVDHYLYGAPKVTRRR